MFCIDRNNMETVVIVFDQMNRFMAVNNKIEEEQSVQELIWECETLALAYEGGWSILIAL